MFCLEKAWESLDCQARYQARQEELQPLMQEFFDWCRRNKATVLPGSKLGKAINCTLKHQEFFEHGNLELSTTRPNKLSNHL